MRSFVNTGVMTKPPSRNRVGLRVASGAVFRRRRRRLMRAAPRRVAGFRPGPADRMHLVRQLLSRLAAAPMEWHGADRLWDHAATRGHVSCSMKFAILLPAFGLLFALGEPAHGQVRPIERFPLSEHGAFVVSVSAVQESGFAPADALALRILGSLVGTAAGGVAARGLWLICDGVAAECPHAAWIPALALTAAGTSAGVALAAERAGRRPAWLHTLVGAGLGAVPGMVVMMRSHDQDNMGRLVALSIFVPGAIAGALIGNYVGQ